MKRIFELESSITQKYEVETNRKFGQYEQNVAQLNAQNEELRRNLANYEQNNVRVTR